MQENVLQAIDEKLFSFLENNVSIMPSRLAKLIAYNYTDARIRKLYLRRLNVFMDEGTFSNLGLLSDATEDAPVIIGKRVSIAPNVTFITQSEPNNSEILKNVGYVKNRLIKSEKIVIEDDVWIGAGVTILPGVTIHEKSIIGAGAVVINNVDAESIYAGIPAKKIRTLDCN